MYAVHTYASCILLEQSVVILLLCNRVFMFGCLYWRNKLLEKEASPRLINRFPANQGYCASCRKKLSLAVADMCPCGKRRTMSHIVNSCPQTKLDGGLQRLHSSDDVIIIIIIIIKGIYIAQARKGHKCATLPLNDRRQRLRLANALDKNNNNNDSG